jgi:hypothetical protein
VSEEIPAYMAAPVAVADNKLLPRRNGHRGLLPSTWLQRELRLDYVATDGTAASATGVLLDWFPLGPVLNVKGTRTLLSWDVIRVVELVEDEGLAPGVGGRGVGVEPRLCRDKAGWGQVYPGR